MPLVGLAGIIPLALVVAVLVPAPRPLDFLMAPVQSFLLGVLLYQLCLNAFGMRRFDVPSAVPPRSRFAILVPAHKEEAVIAHLIASLRAQEYPGDLFKIFVVADNCTDRTSEVARVAGAVVYERRDPPEAAKVRL